MPRITQAQKELNRHRIVEAAAERFRARGMDGVGIDELMKSAGMTHGGFYNHFASKEALAAEVCQVAFADSLRNVSGIIDGHPRSPREALSESVAVYLSTMHRDHPEIGCPSAALVVDAGRHGVDVQNEYLKGLEGYISDFTRMIEGMAKQDGLELEPGVARERAIATFAEMVGTLVLSRAIAKADRHLADEVLATNRRHLTP